MKPIIPYMLPRVDQLGINQMLPIPPNTTNTTALIGSSLEGTRSLPDMMSWVDAHNISQWIAVMKEYVQLERQENDRLKTKSQVELLDDIEQELLVLSYTIDRLHTLFASYRKMWLCRDWRIGSTYDIQQDITSSMSKIRNKLELYDFIQRRFER